LWRVVDLSHQIEHGMTTYPEIPSPIGEHLTREASRAHYAPGTEFRFGRISLVGNTGTYIDSPFHRYVGGSDLATTPLERMTALDGVVVNTGDERVIDVGGIRVISVSGRAVLFRTDWSRHWGSDAYFATHRASADVFTVGAPASFGVKEIAENGNLTPLAEALGASGQVSEVFVGGMPIVPEGLPGSAMFPDSVTFEISAELGARRLSWVSMLICTNDGFTGLDSMTLPAHIADAVSALTAGYDAGTEINTEDFADIVPPCQGLIGVSSGEPGTGMSDPTLAEGGVIHQHDGIVGGADLLPEVHGWDVDAILRLA
jgi:Putative cyclase/Spondin_N